MSALAGVDTAHASESPRGCTCFKVRRLSRAMSRFYDQELADTGLKITQYSLLKTVAIEPVALARLATLLGLERTTLTRNLKPLLDAGLVTREAGSDARSRVIHLSARGRHTLTRGRVAWKRAQLHLQELLGEPFVNDLHHRIDATLDQIRPLITGD